MVNVRLVNPASLTLEEVSRRQKKAVEFTRHVAKDAALADELEALTPEQYAKRKGFRLENPSKDEKENEMVTTDQKLIQKIEELCDSNRQLAEMIRRSQSVATEVSRRAKSSTRRVSNPNGDETQSEVTPLRAVSAERRVKRVSADLDEALDAMQDVQEALDDGDVDEAQEILADVLGDYDLDSDKEEN